MLENGENNLLEYQILKEMKDANTPLGAGFLRETLESEGIGISEAGIGRALRQLRKLGYLERKGFQGHVITESGLVKYAELEEMRKINESLKILMNQAGPLKGYSLAEALIARRALEREAAYQAALNATDGDIKRLEDIIRQQVTDDVRKDDDYANLSTSFHSELINISRVPILKHLYEFVGISIQWQKYFIGTFNRLYDKPLKVSHEKVLNAIKKHDPEEAARLMGEHLSYVFDSENNIYYK